MFPIHRSWVRPFLEEYHSTVDRAALPGSRPWDLQPKVSWQHRNGVYLLLELLRELQTRRILAQEQESCHTV